MLRFVARRQCEHSVVAIEGCVLKRKRDWRDTVYNRMIMVLIMQYSCKTMFEYYHGLEFLCIEAYSTSVLFT